MLAADWIIAVLPLLIVLAAGLFSRRYVRSVADFVACNRSAGRYLLCIAGGELQAGAVVFVAQFEAMSQSGFSLSWWATINVPVIIIMSVTGFVVYRYRETRAMTLAQFFELRYNKSFRVFSGILGFLAGIFNFGIIPSIGARCLVYFLGLPENVAIFSHPVPTYIPLMAVFLGTTVFIALSGGIITVMVINCIEGIMSQLFYLVIIGALLYIFDWNQIRAALMAAPAGQSMLNPFDTAAARDFNLQSVLMGVALSVYGRMAWQNAGGYNGAGLTAHETRMAGVLTGWRDYGKGAVITLLGVCAYTFLNHPDFAAGAAKVHAMVGQIADSHARQQMEMPIALSVILPTGVKGVICAVLLMGIFGGDATHLHSWGSIFVQDVLVPLREKPFGPARHLWVLRCSIVGVALFAFIFGVTFHQTEYIQMWWTVTQSIFMGGAGAAIIGGLYWKKGTSAGAVAAFITGSVLSVGGIVARQIYGEGFPLNGIQIAFVASLISVVVYIVVSLATCRGDFDLDRMLHRGPYAALKPALGEMIVPAQKEPWLARIIGIDSDFTRGDRWLSGVLFGWSMLFLAIFTVGCVWNLVVPWPISVWAAYWHVVGLGIPILLALVTGIWFTIGGVRDVRALFTRLEQQHTNAGDDGTVVNHQNLDDVTLENKSRETETATATRH